MRAEAASYPDHIVNGDFEYMGIDILSIYNSGYALISSMNYIYYSNSPATPVWKALPSNFDYNQFGWKSTQNRYTEAANANLLNCVIRNGAVEIQGDIVNGTRVNTHCELVEQQAGTAIYQDIATTPGSVYKWSLKHCSQSTAHVDTMSVMIGNIATQTAQQATRTTSNGTGQIGPVGTVSHTDNLCSLEGINEGSGNELDDISFTIADPLYYDLNGGMGSLPIPEASGTYPGYFQRGTTQTLSDIIPLREGYTFLGWTISKHADITSSNELTSVITTSTKKIEAGSNYVYALWVKNPTVILIDSMNNTTKSESVTFQDCFLLPADPIKHGYTFVEWNTAADGTGEAIDQSYLNSVDSDICTYAIWKASPLDVSKQVDIVSDNNGNIIPNEYLLTLSANGRTWTKNKHLIFILDRTGSLTQPVYDEVTDSLISLSQDLISQGNVRISCVLFSGTNNNPDSQYYSGYYIPFIDSQNISDFEKIRVPVSTTVTGIINGIDYTGEQYGGTSWHSGFLGLSDIMNEIQGKDSDEVDIVFFSDGDTNAYVNDDGQCVSDGGSGKAIVKASEALSKVLETHKEQISSFSSVGLDYDTLSENVRPSAFDELSRPAITAYIEDTNTQHKDLLSENTDYDYVYDSNTNTIIMYI